MVAYVALGNPHITRVPPEEGSGTTLLLSTLRKPWKLSLTAGIILVDDDVFVDWILASGVQLRKD